MATRRTDIHRPSATEFTPENYRFHGAFDLHPDATYGADFRKHLVASFTEQGKHFAGHQKAQTCGHCGVHIRYGALMEHTETNELIWIGETCLGKRFREANAQFTQSRTQAKRQREARERIATFDQHVADATEYDPSLAILDSYEACEKIAGFLCDIRSRMFRSPLTPKQLAAAVKVIKGHEERQQRMADEKARSKPAPEGLVTITGKIRAVKIDRNPYGPGERVKLTIRDDREFSVHVTAPAAITRLKENTYNLVGERIRMDATLEQAPDDATFAFGSRPAKAALLPATEAALVGAAA